MKQTIKENEYEDYDITINLSVKDFEHVFDRKPKNKVEWERFCKLADRGMESQLDWGVIYESIKENMGWD